MFPWFCKLRWRTPVWSSRTSHNVYQRVCTWTAPCCSWWHGKRSELKVELPVASSKPQTHSTQPCFNTSSEHVNTPNITQASIYKNIIYYHLFYRDTLIKGPCQSVALVLQPIVFLFKISVRCNRQLFEVTKLWWARCPLCDKHQTAARWS